MCWIFAYLWEKDAMHLLVNWLKNLEYRGYDSAWISIFNNYWDVITKKAIWRVSNLAFEIENEKKSTFWYNLWIAHTRWATHGWVTIQNTHPHNSQNERFFLVHNWIIENYIDLKKELLNKWYTFYWDTDSEVMAKLIEDSFEKDLETTIKKIKPKITWAYAFAIIDKNNPNEIIAIKLWSPLVIWIDNNNYFLSSDSNALSNITQKYIPIDDNEMVILNRDWYKILSSWVEITKESILSQKNQQNEDLWEFKHFMLKEIFEIPEIIENILWWRINFKTHEIKSRALDNLDLSKIKKIEIIASGSSNYAWYCWAYLLEELAWIETQVILSTEFKYKKQFINDETLYMFISQSGETADWLECLKIVKNKWWKTFWIVNVVWSSIARICENWLYTHCWVERWVAATKSFIWQLLTLLVISLYIWNKKSLDYTKYAGIIDSLKNLKNDIEKVLIDNHKIEKVSKIYHNSKNMFFLWRNMFYPIAMEWSIKCKEISYIHSESYSAWELKHWPISLIQEDFPTVLVNPKNELYEKNISSLKEIQARNWKVIWIISENDKYEDLYDDFIKVPETSEYNALFTSAVSLQLFAYYIALNLWREIDKPRNLAKSVTVE